MTFEEGLRTKILADSAVSAVTAIMSPLFGRAGADKSADSAPAQIIFGLTGRVDLSFIDSPTPYRQAIYDISAVGRQVDYTSIVILADAIEAALNGQHSGYGTVVVDHAELLDVTDKIFDAEAGLIARTLQFRFGFQQ